MTRLPAAGFNDALRAWSYYTNWWAGYAPLRCEHWDYGNLLWRTWPDDHVPIARMLDERENVEIRLGMPWSTIAAKGVGQVSVLWVVVEGSKQIDHAKRLKPLPTFAIAEGGGSRRTLFWALDRTIGYFEAVDRNKKLAYKCGAVQKWSDPDLLWVPCPGTCLREGRSRPAAVRMSRLTTAVYEPDAVTGRLKSPPEPVPWWERKAQ